MTSKLNYRLTIAERVLVNNPRKDNDQADPSPSDAAPIEPAEPAPGGPPPAFRESHQVVEKVDGKQLQHFVTQIRTAEQQVGENIIAALQHEKTVAVLTTVVMGPDGQQRVVSAALDPRLMNQVQQLLAQASDEREEEEPCVGFHCLVKPKTQTA